MVTDSGPGILPADRERIFEKFFRADPQMTYAPSGTGLGLYISRELARRMGGSLLVSSRPAPARRSFSSCPTRERHRATIRRAARPARDPVVLVHPVARDERLGRR